VKLPLLFNRHLPCKTIGWAGHKARMVDEKNLNIFVWKHEMQEINLVLINFNVQFFFSCRHFDEVSACLIGMNFLNKLRH